MSLTENNSYTVNEKKFISHTEVKIIQQTGKKIYKTENCKKGFEKQNNVLFACIVQRKSQFTNINMMRNEIYIR